MGTTLSASLGLGHLQRVKVMLGIEIISSEKWRLILLLQRFPVSRHMHDCAWVHGSGSHTLRRALPTPLINQMSHNSQPSLRQSNIILQQDEHPQTVRIELTNYYLVFEGHILIQKENTGERRKIKKKRNTWRKQPQQSYSFLFSQMGTHNCRKYCKISPCQNTEKTQETKMSPELPTFCLTHKIPTLCT